jgi:hypothetical protein
MWHGEDDDRLGHSDEASWDTAGFPTMRWAGMRTAGSYPEYHMPNDTMETIDATAGGRTFFEQGLRNTLLSSYLTALALDNEPPTAKATATGSGTVTFDAAGSSDPDGKPSNFTWDFGDGSKASGEKVVHTYTKGGSYTARLSVGDNLWPAATAAATAQVEVPAAPAAKKKAKKKSCRAKGKSRKARAKARRCKAKRKRAGRRP